MLAGVVAFTLAAIASRPGLADSGADAIAFIQGMSDQAIASLTPPGISRAEREARARSLLTDNFAVPAIGQFVLGRYWRTASVEERTEYLRLFEDLIVITYVDRFSRYSGERLRVANAVVDAESGDVIELDKNSARVADKVTVGRTLIDDSG